MKFITDQIKLPQRKGPVRDFTRKHVMVKADELRRDLSAVSKHKPEGRA